MLYKIINNIVILTSTPVTRMEPSCYDLRDFNNQRINPLFTELTCDKWQITALFCGSLLGDFLPIQVIYKGKTTRCHPHFKFPTDWHITHSPKHWSTEQTMLQYVDNIITPYVERVREILGENKAAVVVMDNFKGQIVESVILNQFIQKYVIRMVGLFGLYMYYLICNNFQVRYNAFRTLPPLTLILKKMSLH